MDNIPPQRTADEEAQVSRLRSVYIQTIKDALRVREFDKPHEVDEVVKLCADILETLDPEEQRVWMEEKLLRELIEADIRKKRAKTISQQYGESNMGALTTDFFNRLAEQLLIRLRDARERLIEESNLPSWRRVQQLTAASVHGQAPEFKGI